MAKAADNRQLSFGFVAEIDREKAEAQHLAATVWHLQHERDTVRGMLDTYPVEDHELDLMLRGMRMGRFVNHDECMECAYSTSNHIPTEYLDLESRRQPGAFYHVCIRDFFGKCVEWGIVPEGYPEAETAIRESIERRQRPLLRDISNMAKISRRWDEERDAKEGVVSIIRQCSWCGKELGEVPPLDDKRVTHGICEDCEKKYFPDEKVEVKGDEIRRKPA